MKISTAALSFFVLAAALGSLAHGSQARGSQARGSQARGVYRPADCCASYTPRKIRCKFMEAYFERSSGCHLPAIIFITKSGQRVCTNPKDRTAQHCLKILQEKKNPTSFAHTSSPGSSLA